MRRNIYYDVSTLTRAQPWLGERIELRSDAVSTRNMGGPKYGTHAGSESEAVDDGFNIDDLVCNAWVS